MTGIISTLGIASIANAAHLGGLAAGLLMGAPPPRTVLPECVSFCTRAVEGRRAAVRASGVARFSLV